MVINKSINVKLTKEEMDFITWLAARDNVSVARELRQIFYTELSALMDLFDEERKQELKSGLLENLAEWSKAIEERGVIN